MTEPPLIGSVPRAEYLAAARALLDLATVERLAFEPECENPGHENAAHGCEPGTSAAYVWRRLPHPCERRPEHVLLCAGITLWLREHAGRIVTCQFCGEPRTLAAAIELVAPLSRVSDTLAP